MELTIDVRMRRLAIGLSVLLALGAMALPASAAAPAGIEGKVTLASGLDQPMSFTGNMSAGVAPSALGPSFSGPTNYPVGLFPLSVAVADFNGDADPDLAVANDGSFDVSVLLGGLGGSFGATTNFAAGTTTNSVAVADFNGDSNPDLAVANRHGGGVSVLLGGAGGSFGAPTVVPHTGFLVKCLMRLSRVHAVLPGET